MKKNELAATISTAVNSFSFNFAEFTEAMCREHRTLQQRFTKLCIEWLKVCASDDYRYDERNEASHQLAKKVMDILGDDTALPFI